jgi:hypothetical protein
MEMTLSFYHIRAPSFDPVTFSPVEYQSDSGYLKARGKTMDKRFTAAGHFFPQDRVIDVSPLGSGNINDTFLVTMDTQGNSGEALCSSAHKYARFPETGLGHAEHARCD